LRSVTCISLDGVDEIAKTYNRYNSNYREIMAEEAEVGCVPPTGYPVGKLVAE